MALGFRLHITTTLENNTQFWYKEDWKATRNQEKAEIYNAFNPANPQGVQILYVKEYRPGMNVYSLPGYFGALNYIERRLVELRTEHDKLHQGVI